jgi:hypothetical protein
MLRNWFKCYVSSSADLPLKPITPPAVCNETRVIYNSTGDYQKTICLITQNLNYTDARLNCNDNGMQLYDIVDVTGSDSKTSLLDYANKKWAQKSGNVLHVKGRRDINCGNIDNTLGSFVDGFGACNRTTWSVCQFISTDSKSKNYP